VVQSIKSYLINHPKLAQQTQLKLKKLYRGNQVPPRQMSANQPNAPGAANQISIGGGVKDEQMSMGSGADQIVTGFGMGAAAQG